MAPQTNTPNASNANAQPTSWIDGAKPHFQTLRLSTDAGRIFVGAKGWNKSMQRSEWVSLELTPAGLHQLLTAGAKTLASIQGN